MRFQEFKVRRNPKCPVCGDQPTITKLIDYEQFCGVRGQEAPAPIAADGETTVEDLKQRLDRRDNVFILDVRNPGSAIIEAGQHDTLDHDTAAFCAFFAA